jgi:hypothetical protein
MQLSQVAAPFDNPDWLFEIKHDGFRALAYISEGTCTLVSRKNNQYKSFATLRESLAKLKATAILDGEIECLDAEGKSHFMPLLTRKAQASFYAFDLLWLRDKDLRGLPLVERKQRLHKLLAKRELPGVIYANHIEPHGIALYQEVLRAGFGGNRSTGFLLRLRAIPEMATGPLTRDGVWQLFRSARIPYTPTQVTRLIPLSVSPVLRSATSQARSPVLLLYGGAITLLAAFAVLSETRQTYPKGEPPLTNQVSNSRFVDSLTKSESCFKPLAPSLSNFSFTPLSFSFTDGNLTLTQANVFGSTFDLFNTDASGAITQWDVELGESGCSSPPGCGGGSQLGTQKLFSSFSPSFGPFALDNTTGTFNHAFAAAAVSNAPGTWIESTTVSTPEPGILLLFAIGLVALLGQRRRNRSG